MTKNLPDKWIRKAIFEAINNIIVDTYTIPCFDSGIVGNNIPNHFVLMSTQTSLVSKTNKCEDSWESSILLDIVTTFDESGNTSSRLLADNIADEVRNLTDVITLDVASGLNVLRQHQNFENDIATISDTQTVFRKLLRIELTIN